MLFGDPNTAHYAARQPLEVEPEAKWHYSSGTTNIIAGIIKGALDDDPGPGLTRSPDRTLTTAPRALDSLPPRRFLWLTI